MSNLAECSCGARFLASEVFCPQCDMPTVETTIRPDTEPVDDTRPAPAPADVVLSPADRLRASILTTEQIAAVKPPDQLVNGVLALNSLAMLYGPSGVGKSFVAEDLALHIAHGAWWQGREVKAGSVLYVVAEGAASFGPRLTAWKKHHQLFEEKHPIGWIPMAVNVHDLAWAGSLAEVVGELRPVLVVIDTLARCIVGAEENSAKDIGVIVHNLDRIRRAAGSCVMVVHHSGKNTDAGARGSSALRGAMDTELSLEGDAAYLQLKNPKQKDGPQSQPFTLRLTDVPGTKSVVVTDARTSPDALPEKIAQVLAALMDADVPEGLTTATWLEVSEVPKSTFYKHKAELLRRDLVVNVSDTRTQRYRPAPDAGKRVAADAAAAAVDWDEV